MTSVCIIEDDIDYAQSLAALIENNPRFRCLGTYTNCEDSFTELERLHPDVVLLDIALPGMSGVLGATEIKRRLPNSEIMMLTIHEDNDMVFDSLRNGASGYLLKNVDEKKLIDALTEIKSGGAPMSMTIARKITDSFKSEKHDPLTDREEQVLSKLEQGKSYQTIANELFIAKSTVKFHIKNIYNKLHVSSLPELLTRKKSNL